MVEMAYRRLHINNLVFKTLCGMGVNVIGMLMLCMVMIIVMIFVSFNKRPSPANVKTSRGFVSSSTAQQS